MRRESQLVYLHHINTITVHTHTHTLPIVHVYITNKLLLFQYVQLKGYYIPILYIKDSPQTTKLVRNNGCEKWFIVLALCENGKVLISKYYVKVGSLACHSPLHITVIKTPTPVVSVTLP